MSLPALAQHIQAQGRNNDSMLVHMTPKEVGGLQALAMAHGGSLTINPETGLPEAGFLSKLLPTLIGAGLTIFSGGALSPLMAAGIVGAGTGLATGSLEKGLMAGLGAYGGAGLGAGITGTAANAVPAATTSAPATLGANTAIQSAGAGGANQFSNYLANSGQIGGKAAFDAKSLFNLQQAGGAPMGVPTTQIAKAAADPTWYNPSTWQSSADKFMPGMKASFGNGMEGLKSLYGNLPTGTLPALGAYALMSGDKKGISPADNTGMIRPYSLDRQQNQGAYNTQIGGNGQRMATNAYGEPMDSSERTFFTDTYTAGKPYKAPGPEYAADGGIVGLAVGGQPEQQAAFQAVGMNANYPMAQLQTPMYSDPGAQRPMAREVVNPSGDVSTDEFTGEARMAGGGMTAFGSGGAAASSQASAPTYSYKYNPQNMEYTETKTTPPAARGPFGMLGLPGMGGTFGNRVGSGPASLALQQFYGGMGGRQAPQPTVETQILGGTMPAYIPPQQQSPQSDIAQYATGGIANLGGYSDGGRLLRGPGDGVSDSIPASIGDRQPARLADGEFVVPARIVSEIGNGSTEAGARKLYKMMDRVQHARRKTVGKNQVAKNTKAERLLPA
jgi:hypothetical protein